MISSIMLTIYFNCFIIYKFSKTFNYGNAVVCKAIIVTFMDSANVRVFRNFLKIRSLDFSDFLHEVRGHGGS